VRLVVDASILVSEALRQRGHELIAPPELELLIAEHAWSEVRHELRRRVTAIERQGRFSAAVGARTFAASIALISHRVRRVVAADYRAHEAVARSRIPRDPDDWPTVAAALAVGADIWTNDADFLGCGIATWTTETLLAHLSR